MQKFTFFYYLILIDVFLSIFATKLSFYLRKPSRSQLLDKLPDNIWNFSDFSPNRISYFVLECVIASFIAFCGELYAIMMEYLYYAWFFFSPTCPRFPCPRVRVRVFETTHCAPPPRLLIDIKNNKWLTYFYILLCIIMHLPLFLSSVWLIFCCMLFSLI